MEPKVMEPLTTRGKKRSKEDDGENEREKVHVTEEEHEMKGEKSIYLLFSVAAVFPRVCLFSCPSVPKLSTSSSPQLPSHTSHFLIFCFFFLFLFYYYHYYYCFCFPVCNNIRDKRKKNIYSAVEIMKTDV